MIKVKVTGIPAKSETDEIDVMFEAILGQVESDKSNVWIECPVISLPKISIPDLFKSFNKFSFITESKWEK